MVQSLQYKPFTREKWQGVVARSINEFSESIGGKPKRNAIATKLPDSHKLDFLNRLAIIMLVVVSVFGAFKLGLTALPLAERLIEQNLHTSMPEFMNIMFKLSVIVSAAFTGVFGLIYFKMVTESSSTRTKIETSRRMSKFRVEWWSPRLNYVLVALTIIIMVVVSNTANKPIQEGGLFDVLFNNTVVVMELALSYPVGIWLGKRQARARAIDQAFDEANEVYTRRMDNYETDFAYLRILFQNASEELFNIDGDRTNRKPNAHLREESVEKVEEIIASEYKRLQGGIRFSREIGKFINSPAPASTTPYTTPKTKGQKVEVHIGVDEDTSDPESEISTKPAEFEPVDRVVPPLHEKTWTRDTMMTKLIQMNAPRDITEEWLNQNFAPSFNARKVWRDGLRDEWND